MISEWSTVVGSVLYLLGSAIFTVQAIVAGDAWASIASMMFLVSAFAFVYSSTRRRPTP